ncbi:helix-turn-helix transcriptional regulator [Microcoleus sp. FACHB-SPT15]|uniref:winged helix-turn-helix transcriptional regulator n=1 Tax=Microcoleus sp. FACHB-SPT15 TaxID=2692830 RepID=UPI0017815E11|nr:helix-turn-helix domain-containing protein [Microcoleus sp. FACHB-SPT15]MBD1805087.1 helix-turn-helix transcriptional regulator [Microcoleus sp. FACHB-SPT15]
MLETSECLKVKCPIQFTLDIIGSKWALLILRELFTGNRRTHEFLEALPGISTKTLTIRLRELEAYGLVSRHVFPEIPPRVEYSLTEKGQDLQPVMASLYQVGQRWLQRDDCECPLNVNVATKLEHLA